MGLDVAGCCRLCLKDATASEVLARIDLQQRQEVGELVQELYDLNIKQPNRGSKFICVPCYKEAANLKKYVDLHQSKARLVSLNQLILSSQVEAFPKKKEQKQLEDKASYDESQLDLLGISSGKMRLSLEDCMRSQTFRESLEDRYDLAYLQVSGPVYQEDSDTFLDMWYPITMHCHKCTDKFISRAALDSHQSACKFKCVFCKRYYVQPDFQSSHSCPTRDKYRKSKKKSGSRTTTPQPPPKRAKTVDREVPSATVAVEKTATQNSSETTTLNIVSMTDVLPAPANAPYIEGAANLDDELSNLLERWYGQAEDIEELSHLNMGTVEAPNDNGVFTNSDLYSRVIDTAFREETIVRKPAISVKPMSQLIGASNVPITPTLVSEEIPSRFISDTDVIEIDDDDDVEVGQVVAPTGGVPHINRQDQQALSETDILNIVKHFRGIDENESYLIKAKINGAQKLICISKRKGEGNTPESSTASIVNNNSALQSSSRIHPAAPALLVPAANQQAAASKNLPTGPPPLVRSVAAKNVPGMNGPPNPATVPSSSVPQLKIAHVQSLNQDPQIARTSMVSQRVLNGKPTNSVVLPASRFKVSGANTTMSRLSTSTIPMKTPPTNIQSQSAAKPAPRRIVVGSNSIKLLNTPHQQKSVTLRPSQVVGTSTATTSTQQRIIVQRKQVQTIIQSSISRTTTTGSSVQNVGAAGSSNNSLLRTHLSAAPQRIYPSAGVPTHQNGNRTIQPKPTTSAKVDGMITSLTGSAPNSKQFKLNNTTIRRLE